ncbi:VOC family protein [Actinomadura sp. B10D3]|uniref:VOC family protein n=1 Tax=Actinomadura sp. B10D3 TaxID=3153557 RepID=UPI00325C410F
MRTLHPAYRVADLPASLDFYTALGYQLVGRVDVGGGTHLAMLKFPDDEVVTLELVHRPSDGPVNVGTGYRIELVQWPPGHPYGLTAADFA